jgi:hypothetical protein
MSNVSEAAAKCTQCTCRVVPSETAARRRPLMDWVTSGESSCRFPPWGSCPHFTELLARYLREVR